MTSGPIAELKDAISTGRVTIIVGAGISIAATNNADVASWKGLLRSGVNRCAQPPHNMPDDIANIVRLQVDSGNVDMMIQAASTVTRTLGGTSSGDFRRWLRETVGSLRPIDRTLIDAICGLNSQLATTNYDGLLEEVSGLRAVPWTNDNQVTQVIHRHERGVLHLHGYWEASESVVLGDQSYSAVMANPHAEAVLRALAATQILVFVGFGSGLADPNFSSLLSWCQRAFQGVEVRHFMLARNGEYRELQEQVRAARIVVLGYGENYEDLAPFLRSLAPGPSPPAVLRTGSRGGLTTVSPSIGFGARIQRFIHEYVGTHDSPVPFGGRAADLAALTDWLDGPDTPAYGLLAAPSGRGKSALLVNWTRSLAWRPDIDLIFVPISLRFQTSNATVVLIALVSGLAAVHGESVEGLGAMAADQLRELAAVYLSHDLPDGRTLLVVLDGADETSEWEVGPDLFPTSPPDRLKLLMSARILADDTDAEGWLDRLGWNRGGACRTFSLSTLAPDGVEDALASLGSTFEAPPARRELSEALYSLSGGDPLVARLYLDDFVSAMRAGHVIDVGELRSTPPGLDSYLRRWWSEQTAVWGSRRPLLETHVREVLSLLATALGPLSREDLAEVAGAESGLSTFVLQDAIDVLGRWVVGDGRVQGYVFSHPRLADFFRGQLLAVDSRRLEGRFLAWGATIVGQMDGDSDARAVVPGYLVQHYAVHLLRSGSTPESMLTLVRGQWWQASEAYAGHPGMFLADIDRAVSICTSYDEASAATGTEISFLGGEVRCALFASSIKSRATNIPPCLVPILVEKGIWMPAQALAYSLNIMDATRRSRALGDLAPHLSENLLRTALADARTMPAAALHSPREWALTGLIGRLAGLGHGTEAVREAEGMGRWQNTVLAQVIPHLPEPVRSEQVDLALSRARFASHEADRAQLLGLVAKLVDATKFGIALSLARAIQEHWILAHCLRVLSEAAPAEDRQSLADEAFGAARQIESRGQRASEIVKLAPLLSQQKVAAALVEAWSLHDDDQTKALTALLPRLSGEQHDLNLTRAFESVKEMSAASERADALAAIAPVLTETLLDEALQIADGLEASARPRRGWEALREPGLYRARALEGLLPRMAEHRRTEEAWSLANALTERSRRRAIVGMIPHLQSERRHEALRAILTDDYDDEDDRTETLSSVKHFVSDELAHEVVSSVLLIDDESELNDLVVGVLLPALARLGGGDDVLNELDEIDDEELKAGILSNIAEDLPDAFVERAFQVASSLADDEERWWAQLRLIRRYADRGHEAEAFNVVQEIGNASWRAQGLARLNRPDDALAAVRSIQSRRARCRTFMSLGWMDEALREASSIANTETRSDLLLTIVESADGPTKSDAIDLAFRARAELADQWNYEDFLEQLAPHLDQVQLDALSAELSARRDRQATRRSLISLLAQRAALGYVDEVLAEIPRFLQPSGNPDQESQDRLRSRLVPVLASVGRLTDARSLAGEIRFLEHGARAFVSLADYVEGTDLEEVLKEAVEWVSAIDERKDRRLLLEQLSPRLLTLPRLVLYEIWSQAFPRLARRSRFHLVSDLSALVPVMAALGGHRAIRESIHAVREAGRWWP